MDEGAVPGYGALCGQSGYQACTFDKVRHGPVTARTDSLQRGFVAAWVPGCPLAETARGGGGPPEPREASV